VSFVAITLCVASQRMFIVVIVYFVTTQSRNFWIRPHVYRENKDEEEKVNNNENEGEKESKEKEGMVQPPVGCESER